MLAPLLAGFGGPQPFRVALMVRVGDNYAPGPWMESSSVFDGEEITVVVMATWCPHCERMLEEMSRSADAARRVDAILFFDSEYVDSMRRGGADVAAIARQAQGRHHLVSPERVATRRLPFYFAKKPEFGALVSGYPTVLSCRREGCLRVTRAAAGLG